MSIIKNLLYIVASLIILVFTALEAVNTLTAMGVI